VAFTGSVPTAVLDPLLIVCSIAYGIALTFAGVRIAAAIAQNRLPELCQVAIQSTA
jgi:hypothetical protein